MLHSIWVYENTYEYKGQCIEEELATNVYLEMNGIYILKETKMEFIC